MSARTKGEAMKSKNKAGAMQGINGVRFSAEIDAELFNRAEQELAAFVAAVDALHGEEQARAAAGDWLLEFIALEEPCNDVSSNFRSLTIGAARRLVHRLSIPWPAHAILVAIAGILLLIAPANAQAAHSDSRHPVRQDKLASVSVSRESSRISTIPAGTRTMPCLMCSLLIVGSRAQQSLSVRTNSTQE